MMSFMYGTAEVATAKSVGSVGEMATEDGENAIQALDCGARFCDPNNSISVGSWFSELGASALGIA